MEIPFFRTLLALSAIGSICRADTFGSGPNIFTIDFVTVGNPGNPNDSASGGGSYFSAYGGVSYTYRMGVTEVAADWVAKAGSLPGLTTSTWTGNKPAAFMSWFEAATFVNWLNESSGYQKAYDLSYSGGWIMNLWSSGDAWQLGGENLFRHKDAVYFLPSENEWYKAAYHKNDGATGNYWDYATASDSVPDGIDFPGDTAFDAVFVQPGANATPNDVDDVGVPSPYGTLGQNGNVVEWLESAHDGTNDSALENRVFRDNSWNNGFGEQFFRSSHRSNAASPSNEGNGVGFRVASIVPEPSSAAMLLMVGGVALARRRRMGQVC
jgi:formylglycine-generating enzyme